MSLHSKLAFCKNYLYHALLYLEPKHGLLASTFKVLTGLLIWPDADEGDLMDEEFDSESDA